MSFSPVPVYVPIFAPDSTGRVAINPQWLGFFTAVHDQFSGGANGVYVLGTRTVTIKNGLIVGVV